MKKLTAALRKVARRHPDVEEGVACAGTALESTTFKVGGKAFLFVGPLAKQPSVRVKLDDSRAEATALAKKQPERYRIGANGWATVLLAPDEVPPLDVLARWIDESYRLMAAPAQKPKKASKASAKTKKRG